MQSIEEELTQVLQDQAESVPPDPRLLMAVKARRRRSVVTRRLALTAAVAGAIAAVVVLPSVAGLPTLDGTQGQQPAAGRDGFLVDAPAFEPAFPFTLTYVPPGLTTKPELSAEPGIINASYRRVHPGTDEGSIFGLNIAVIHAKTLAPRNPPLAPNDKPVSVTVLGHPATFVQSQSLAPGTGDVTWQNKPGEWVILTGSYGYGDRQTVVRIANSLVPNPIKPVSRITVKLAPPNFKFTQWGPDGVTLEPGPAKPDTFGGPESISVQVAPATKDTDGQGKPVTVGKYSGWLKSYDGTGQAIRYVVLKLSATTRLIISVPGGAPWNDERLLEFASGVSYAAQPSAASNE